MTPQALELHPLCTLFPRVTGSEFDDLVADIRANGLREPITTKDGMVLDGGNRYAACIEAGAEIRTVEYEGDDIVAFVYSKNLHRRHLKEGQRAAIVASAANWAAAQSVGRPKLDTRVHLSTTQSRADEANVHRSTQKKADKIAKAAPEKAAEVARGEKTLNEAIREIAQPKPIAPEDEPPEGVETAPAHGAEPPPPDEPQPELTVAEAARAQIAQLNEQLADVTHQRDILMRVTDTCDPLASALAEVQRLTEINGGFKRRIDSLVREKGDAARRAIRAEKDLEKERKRALRLEKELGEAKQFIAERDF